MEKVILKGSKDGLLNSVYQFLSAHLSTSLPDFSILQYIYEELFTFLLNKNIDIHHIELYFESNLLNSKIQLDTSADINHSFRSEIENFLTQTGLYYLLRKFVIDDNYNFIFNYSLSYIDGTMTDKRQQLIQSYWKNALKIQFHD